MAVPTWRRHPNDECDYIYNIFTYNTFLGLMVHNGPRKYMNTYGKYIIHAGCSALKYASTANRTRIKDKSSYNFRRNNLLKVFGIIDSLCIVCYIYLSILKNDDSISAKTRKKIARWEKEVGIRTNKIMQQISNVESYDNDFYCNLPHAPSA